MLYEVITKYYDNRVLLLDNTEPDRITTSEKKPLLVDFVITSYSIHYTKLYETSQRSPSAPPRVRCWLSTRPARSRNNFV